MDTKGPDSKAIYYLTYLGGVTDHIKALEVNQRDTVQACREHGASWRMIGVALGVSTQACWDRFSGHERDSEIPEQPGLWTSPEGD